MVGDARRSVSAGGLVSVHVRQSPETLGMIRAEHFAMMKPGASSSTRPAAASSWSKTLSRRCKAAHCGGRLDVFETEPLPSDSPLRLLPNVVLTPHAAGHHPRSNGGRAGDGDRQTSWPSEPAPPHAHVVN
jgi:hypothetical protein